MTNTTHTALIARAMGLATKINEHGSLTRAEFTRFTRLARALRVRPEDLVEAAR